MRLFKKKNDVKKSSEKIGEFKMDYLPDDQHDGEYGEHKPKAKNSESRVIQTEYEYENEKDTNQNTDLNEQDELQKRIALGFSMPIGRCFGNKRTESRCTDGRYQFYGTTVATNKEKL